MADVQQHVGMQEEDRAVRVSQGMRGGAIIGLVLGLVLGVTFWTHSMDLAHFGIAVLIVLACAAVGLFIGRTVCGLASSNKH